MTSRTGLIFIGGAVILAISMPQEPPPERTPPAEIVATILAPCFAAVPEEHRDTVRGMHVLSDGHAMLMEAARLYPLSTRRLVSDPTFRELCDERGIGELLRYVESAERLGDLLLDERLLRPPRQ